MPVVTGVYSGNICGIHTSSNDRMDSVKLMNSVRFVSYFNLQARKLLQADPKMA